MCTDQLVPLESREMIALNAEAKTLAEMRKKRDAVAALVRAVTKLEGQRVRDGIGPLALACNEAGASCCDADYTHRLVSEETPRYTSVDVVLWLDKLDADIASLDGDHLYVSTTRPQASAMHGRTE